MSFTEKNNMPNENAQNKHENAHQKSYAIVVNGREKQVTQQELSYEDLRHLAYENPISGPNIVTTITFRRGHGNKPEGSLLEGQTVRVKEGMIFNVSITDKS